MNVRPSRAGEQIQPDLRALLNAGLIVRQKLDRFVLWSLATDCVLVALDEMPDLVEGTPSP
ncbi:MAG: hypothetical protein QOD39_1105 [Mycobacterium sp.]|jgi:hypothetical protein|nr:hypothetical protein [Mycobacterium sp.]